MPFNIGSNLKHILNQDHEDSFKIKVSVETSVTNLFKTWQRDVMKVLKTYLYDIFFEINVKWMMI